MPDIDKDIERILNSDFIDSNELVRVANVLRDEGRYDLIDQFTQQLLRKHTDDEVLLLRAWYLVNVEENYHEAGDILRTIGTSDDVMFALLRATVVLRSSYDADKADDILQEFTDSHEEVSSDIAIEAARLFINSQFTDLAEKWISMYDGDKNNDYLMVYGDILVAEEEHARAAEMFRKVTSADPADAEAWIKLSDVLISMKDYEAAIGAAQHALDDTAYDRKALENIRMCNLCIIRHNNRIINNQ